MFSSRICRANREKHRTCHCGSRPSAGPAHPPGPLSQLWLSFSPFGPGFQFLCLHSLDAVLSLGVCALFTLNFFMLCSPNLVPPAQLRPNAHWCKISFEPCLQHRRVQFRRWAFQIPCQTRSICQHWVRTKSCFSWNGVDAGPKSAQLSMVSWSSCGLDTAQGPLAIDP